MENNILRFKTNIHCGGCVGAVRPHLERLSGISSWEVDTENQDKILTVNSSGATAEEVLSVVKKAGFEAEPIV